MMYASRVTRFGRALPLACSLLCLAPLAAQTRPVIPEQRQAVLQKKARGGPDSQDLAKQRLALLKRLRRSAGLSRAGIDRLTRRAIPFLHAGDEDLVTSILEMLSERPYGPGNPDSLTWERALKPLLAHKSREIARRVPRVILHRLPESAVARRLLVDACFAKDSFVYEGAWFSLRSLEMSRVDLPLVTRLLESRRKWCRILGLDFLRDIHGGVIPMRFAPRLLEMQKEGRDKVRDELPRCISSSPPAEYLERLVFMSDLSNEVESYLQDLLESEAGTGHRLTSYRVLRHYGKISADGVKEYEETFRSMLARDTSLGFPVAWSRALDESQRSNALARMKDQLQPGNLIASPNVHIDKSWRVERQVLRSLAKKEEATSAARHRGWYVHKRNARTLRQILASLKRKR